MRLSSIEKYHFFDDPAELPNSVICRMSCLGEIDPGLVDQCAVMMSLRHPFLKSGVESTNKLRWVQKYQGPTIVWCENGIPDALPEISLVDEPGIRAYFAIQNGRTEIMLQVHHAICDGGGGISLIRDFCLAYHNLVAGRPVAEGLIKLRPRLLRDRNRIGLLEWQYLKHLYKQPIAVFGASKFLFRDFFELESEYEVPGVEVPFPSLTGYWLDEQQTQAAIDRSQQQNIRLNSLLLGMFYLAIQEWKTERIGQDENQWLRVIMPMSVRQTSHLRMPAANRATVVQMDRRKDQLEDESNFFYYLNREVDIIRGWQFDKIFMLLVRAMSVSRAWLERSARNPSSRGTAIFTNLGEPFRWARKKGMLASDSDSVKFGNLKMDSFDFIGPVRRGTPLNLSVQRHGGRIRISIHWDPRKLQFEDADWIAKRFIYLAGRLK